MLQFWKGSTNVLVIYICHLIWTVDNVNTRTALELLRELIGEVNIYMASARSTDRTPNRMILKNIATYITSLFKVSTHYWWAPTPLHCSRLLPEKAGQRDNGELLRYISLVSFKMFDVFLQNFKKNLSDLSCNVGF